MDWPYLYYAASFRTDGRLWVRLHSGRTAGFGTACPGPHITLPPNLIFNKLFMLFPYNLMFFFVFSGNLKLLLSSMDFFKITLR